MTKLAYLSTSALCALALTASVTSASAAPPPPEMYGSVSLGYSWLNYDPDGFSDFHNNTFVAQGAFGLPLGGPWAVEGNFSFETQQFDDFGVPVDLALDTWQLGGVLVYNFNGDGRLGFDLAYETADFGVSIDGYRVGARGEYYAQPNLTLRASAGYQDYDGNLLEADGFYGSLGASYYFTRSFGVRGTFEYYEYDLSFGPLTGDYNAWDLGAKLQYKCDDYPIVLGGHVNYAQADVFGGGDTNVWNLGVDLTAMFGSGAANASLRDAEANTTFEPQRIGIKYITF